MHEEATELLKERLDKEIDMYKFHVDLAVKIAPVILAIAGSMLAFLATRDNIPIMLSILSLLVPLLLCIGFCVIYFQATTAAGQMERTHEDTATRLRIRPFNMGPLAGVCRVCYLLCGLAAFGIVVVMFNMSSLAAKELPAPIQTNATSAK